MGVVGTGPDDFCLYSIHILPSSFTDSVPNCQTVGCGLRHKLIFVGLVIAVYLDGIEAKIVARCGADVTDGDVGITLGAQITLNCSVDADTIADHNCHVLRDYSIYGVEGWGW